MPTLILKLIFVCTCQALLAWLLYRCRALGHCSWADSDFLVFGVPLLAGFAAAAFVLFRAGVAKSTETLFGLAAILALAASFVGDVVGFNLYGT